MERKIINTITFVSVLFTALCVIILYFFPNLHASAMEQREAMENGDSVGESVLGLIRANTEMTQQSPLENGEVPVTHHLRMEIPDNVTSNYAYFPVRFHGFRYQRDEVFMNLKKENIYTELTKKAKNATATRIAISSQDWSGAARRPASLSP